MNKNLYYKIIFCTITGIVALSFANAQTGNAQTGGANQSAQQNPNFFSQGRTDTLPIKVIPDNNTLPQGKLSLRNDFPYEQAPYQQSNALSYPKINQENISFSVRIWEDIDTRKTVNSPLMYAMDDMGTQPLIAVILKAIRANAVTAFDPQDDRFTTPFTWQQVKDAMGNGRDTVPTYDVNTGDINGYVVRSRTIDPDSIYTYRLKEDFFYDKKYGKMMVRIIGIAPVVPYTLSTGDVIPNSEHPLFWLYFPDIRSVLTKYKGYNMQEPGTKIPFDEMFDLRTFRGQMVKSNYENPGEIPWIYLYPEEADRQAEAAKIRDVINSYGSDNYYMLSQDTPPKQSKKNRNK